MCASLAIGNLAEAERCGRDEDDALQAWSEHGLLDTQLGRYKNGKKS